MKVAVAGVGDYVQVSVSLKMVACLMFQQHESVSWACTVLCAAIMKKSADQSSLCCLAQ